MSVPSEILLATGNAHKVTEMQALADASGLGLRIRGAKDAGGMPPVEEDTGTFEGNATKKARALQARNPGTWVMADDSGLCVDALDGGPGVESANYAGPAAPGPENVAKLLEALKGLAAELRRARFVCILVIVAPDGRETVFEGHVEGTILDAPRGEGGFGYDPVFKPDGFDGSFAELGAEVKNPVSHRGRAWSHLAAWLTALAAQD